MGKIFQQLLGDFYQYCDKQNLLFDRDQRNAVEEFACWLDEYTDSVAKEPTSE